MSTAHWIMLAGYNTWANVRLYGAVRALPAETFRAEAGAFFGSLRGTLNHLLVADRIWMKRLTGEGDAPDRLDAILHGDLGSLSEARAMEGPAHRKLGRRVRRDRTRPRRALPPRDHAGPDRTADGRDPRPSLQPPDTPQRAGACVGHALRRTGGEPGSRPAGVPAGTRGGVTGSGPSRPGSSAGTRRRRITP